MAGGPVRAPRRGRRPLACCPVVLPVRGVHHSFHELVRVLCYGTMIKGSQCHSVANLLTYQLLVDLSNQHSAAVGSRCQGGSTTHNFLL